MKTIFYREEESSDEGDYENIEMENMQSLAYNPNNNHVDWKEYKSSDLNVERHFLFGFDVYNRYNQIKKTSPCIPNDKNILTSILIRPDSFIHNIVNFKK